jgi:hypothetical protein
MPIGKHAGSRQQREDAGGSGQAANFCEGARCLVVRQEADDGGVEAKTRQVAEDNDQHPDEYEDPVFVLAHQAGEGDLETKASAALMMRIENAVNAMRRATAFSPRSVKSPASMRNARPPEGRNPAGNIFSAVSMTAIMNTQNSLANRALSSARTALRNGCGHG